MSNEQKNWLTLVLDLKDSVIPAIETQVGISMSFALFITLIYKQGLTTLHQPALAGLIPGIVLGLLLVFRTNTAYDRFWEGWKIAGTMVFTCRNLARKIFNNVLLIEPEDIEEKLANMRLVYVFYITIISHLRNEKVNKSLKNIISEKHYTELETARNAPLQIARLISDYIYKLYRNNHIDTIQLEAHNLLIDQLIECLSRCERIVAAPMPRAYSIHLRHLLILYCFALPFQLVKDLDWWTIPTVGVIAFALFGIEAIGLEIENPFGYDANDIPLEKLAHKVKGDIEVLIEYHEPIKSRVSEIASA